jgi:endonuclease YncB( thermonuclease family)
MNRAFFWLAAALFFLWSLPLSPTPISPKPRPVTHPPFDTAKGEVFMRCPAPRVYDGDTIVCANGYHLRLLGVQAPEIKCKPGLECVPGDALAAKASLEAGMRLSKRVTYQYIRRDNRNRPVVIVRAGKVNLNCWQLQRTDAILKYDARRLIERECGVKPQAVARQAA